MAITLKLTTEDIRNKMFDFIKPVYKGTYDLDFGYIDWIYGAYESESNIFITYVSSSYDDDCKYILIDGDGDIFYVSANRYRHTLSELPEKLYPYGDTIQKCIKFYNNTRQKERFRSSLSPEQENRLYDIKENMKERCKPKYDINCYEDALALLELENYADSYIREKYNKKTAASFDAHLPQENIKALRTERYKEIISEICAYSREISEEDLKHISQGFGKAASLVGYGINDTCAEITLNAVKKAYLAGVTSSSFKNFIEKYIKSCIKTLPQNIRELRPLSDFMNENMKGEKFKSLAFYIKELNRLIYNKREGFEFIPTTHDIREKMFGYLKPQYSSVNDIDVTNINWKIGVYSEIYKLFLTKIYYVPDGLARCDINYNSYIVIMDKGDIFTVTNNKLLEKGTYDFGIPKEYITLSDKVKEGIGFFDTALYDYTSILDENTKKELEEISQTMDDRCHKNFVINCEEDAKEFFVMNNYNMYMISDLYNRKTVSDFKKFADYEKMLFWRGEKYLEMLNKALDNTISGDQRSQYFCDACNIFARGVNNTYDKIFLNVVKVLYKKHCFSHIENSLRIYIDVYADDFPNDIENIRPLLKFASTHTKDRYLQNSIKNAMK